MVPLNLKVVVQVNGPYAFIFFGAVSPGSDLRVMDFSLTIPVNLINRHNKASVAHSQSCKATMIRTRNLRDSQDKLLVSVTLQNLITV